MYNDYIKSINPNECMDCGNKDIVYYFDERNRKVKQCKKCGKEYYAK